MQLRKMLSQTDVYAVCMYGRLSERLIVCMSSRNDIYNYLYEKSPVNRYMHACMLLQQSEPVLMDPLHDELRQFVREPLSNNRRQAVAHSNRYDHVGSAFDRGRHLLVRHIGIILDDFQWKIKLGGYRD